MTRLELHQLLDQIPESALPRVESFLESLADPVLRALNEAPEDDEPLSDDDKADLQEALDELTKGARCFTHAEVLAQFGDEPDANH